jgi:DNA (cytosine-5)-methyltransferase 1
VNYLSLFSGIGGFDLGFDRAGMQCVCQVEFDKHAASVLEKHWKPVTRYKDVRYVRHESGRSSRNWEWWDWLPDVDVVTGGFPCQDVSIAGRRAGLAGERSGLWFEFYRILAETRPQWVVVENVPGLLSSNGGRDFAIILRGLVELRYGVAWRVLDAQYFGLAQRRKRVFIVGSLGDGRAAQVLFEPESGERHTAPSRKKGQGNSRAFTHRAGTGSETDIAPPLDVKSKDGIMRNQGALGIVDVAKSIMTREGFSHREDQDNYIPIAFHNRQDPDVSGEITHPLGAKALKANASKSYQGVVAPALTASNDPSRSPQSSEVTHQIEAINAAGMGVRRLTPLECERLQGFPDGWTEGQNDTQRYKQLGNAVAVPVAEWIGRRIREAETGYNPL